MAPDPGLEWKGMISKECRLLKKQANKQKKQPLGRDLQVSVRLYPESNGAPPGRRVRRGGKPYRKSMAQDGRKRPSGVTRVRKTNQRPLL